jgi:O-antigen/teichoic acid export membrane protein
MSGQLAPEAAPQRPARRPGRTMRTDLDSGSRAMARGAAINLLGGFSAFFLALGFRFAITHLVTPAAFGRVSLALTIVMFVQIPAILGMDTGVVRYVARAAARGDEGGARGAVQVCLGLTTLASLLFTALVLWQSVWISEIFFQRPTAHRVVVTHDAHEVANLLQIVILGLPALAIGRVAMLAIQGFGVMTYSAFLGVLRNSLNLVGALPLLAIGMGVEGIAIGSVITSVGLCLLGFYFLLRVHPAVFVPAPRRWQPLRILRFSTPQTFTALMFFAILWTDTLMLARYTTPVDVAVYTIVGSLMQPATLVAQAIGQMFAPRIAAEDARGDRATLEVMLKRVTFWNTATSIPLFAALAVIPAPLLAIFGHQYEDGAAALAILAVGQLLNTAAGPLGQVINMSGRPYITMLNNAGVALLNLVSCWILIPRYGLVGAALSTASALTLVNLIKLVQVHRIFGMSPWRADTLNVLAAAGMACAVVLPLAMLVPWPDPVSQALVSSAVLVGAYGVFVWALGLDEEDAALFAAGTARLRRRLSGSRPRRSLREVSQ